MPPRTAILGILGAVLGLPKDEPQVLLEPADIALSGRVPQTHWHKAKLRKDPPEPLPMVVEASRKSDKTGRPEKAALIAQEWLFEPEYTIWVSIPNEYRDELEARLRERRWHFQPSLGLSEMMADLEFLGVDEATPLPSGRHELESVFKRDAGAIDLEQVFEKGLAVYSFTMPRTVSRDRVFTPASYYMERDARTVAVETDQAIKAGDRILTFL